MPVPNRAPSLTAAPLPPLPPHQRIRPRTLVRYGLGFGALMIAAAWLWQGVIRGRATFTAWFPAQGWPGDVLLGIVVGIAFVALAWPVLEFVPAFKRIEQIILRTLYMHALRWPHAVFFGLVAGIPEEILFRGALQAEIGLLPSALIFGLLHAITPAYFVYAAGAGLLLGALTNWQEALWAPVAAHVTIDVLMFLLLIRTWRRTYRPTIQRPAPPPTA